MIKTVRWVMQALALLLMATTALGAQEVTGSMVWNTGPFPCDGQVRNSTITNTESRTARIIKVRLWHGRDFGIVADYQTDVYKANGSLVAIFQQDAYDQSPLRWLDTSYEGRYQSVAPGEVVRFSTFCQQINGTGGRGHTTVVIWWSF